MPECGICGEETGHINNHVRMSAGSGHGPQGEYPEGWDTDDPDAIEIEAEAEAEGQIGPPVDEPAVEQDDDEPGEIEIGTDGQIGDAVDPNDDDSDEDLETLLFEDTEADASEYECESCGTSIPYLGGEPADGGGMECPECGERLLWSMVS